MINSKAIIGRVASIAAASGFFDSVNMFETKSSPGIEGLHYAVWVNNGPRPVAQASGLTAVSARLELTARVYKGFKSEPEAQIDTNITDAVDYLMGGFVGDFELGGEVRNVDIFGAHGAQLDARTGYMSMDRTVFRICDITIPLIINDAWTEVA